MEQEELKGNAAEVEPISMENLEDEALDFDQPKRGQLREGVVAYVRDEGLVVDIGSKRDGFVPMSDLEQLDESEREFSAGQTIPVVVVKSRNSDGNVELSVSQAKLQEDWLKAEHLKAEQNVHEAKVLEANRGGLTVEFGRLRGFVPMSQLIGFSRLSQAAERYRRLRSMVGKSLMLKVIEVNRSRRRLIFSQLAAAKEWRAVRRQRLLEELEAGQVRTGRLSQIADFGLFVNLGGLDGLVHVSELSWGRIESPADVYHVGQRIKVKVLSVDKDRQRIALSIKALRPDPWESVPERYTVGRLVSGKISQIADFGVFVQLETGVEGLLHNSELLSPEQREELEIGGELLVKVIRIEPERRRIGLSVRQVRLEEWEQWAAEAEAEAEAKEAEAEVEETEAEMAADIEADVEEVEDQLDSEDDADIVEEAADAEPVEESSEADEAEAPEVVADSAD